MTLRNKAEVNQLTSACALLLWLFINAYHPEDIPILFLLRVMFRDIMSLPFFQILSDSKECFWLVFLMVSLHFKEFFFNACFRSNVSSKIVNRSFHESFSS